MKKYMKKWLLFPLTALLLAACSLPGLGASVNNDGIVITGGTTTEMQILSYMVRGMVEHYLPDASVDMVKKAAEYLASLNHAGFFRRVDDTDYVDACFMKCIVGPESVLLHDLADIRKKLFEYDCNVYGWWNNPNIRGRLKMMFKKEYELHGKAEAEQIFEHMSADQLREYLRNKLMDPDFGREILKGQR